MATISIFGLLSVFPAFMNSFSAWKQPIISTGWSP